MVASPLLPKIVNLELTAEGEGSASEYNTDVVECEVVSTPGAETQIITLDGTVHKDIGPTSYSLRLVIVQDWRESPMGLARYLWEHRGDTCAFAFNAHQGPGAWGANIPGFTGTVASIIAPTYGGAGNEYAQVELVMPITGEPTLLETAP